MPKQQKIMFIQLDGVLYPVGRKPQGCSVPVRFNFEFAYQFTLGELKTVSEVLKEKKYFCFNTCQVECQWQKKVKRIKSRWL